MTSCRHQRQLESEQRDFDEFTREAAWWKHNVDPLRRCSGANGSLSVRLQQDDILLRNADRCRHLDTFPLQIEVVNWRWRASARLHRSRQQFDIALRPCSLSKNIRRSGDRTSNASYDG